MAHGHRVATHFRRAAVIAALTVVAAAAPACRQGSNGETSSTAYPKRVVTIVTHSSPGGGSDVFLREMAPHLSKALGASIVIENLQGGSGARAMAAVARSAADGGTFYATTPTFIYTSLLSSPPASYSDLQPIVNVFYDPEVLYTAADSPFMTMADVIARARAGGGKWGAANPASLERQTLERLKQKAGVTPAIVSFDGGGDMMINVLNHTLDVGIGELQEIRAPLAAGQLRLLAVVGEGRLRQFADVKTLKELGIDLAVRKFRGLAGPTGTPPEVIAAWERAIPKLLDDPGYAKVYTDNHLEPGFMPHAEYAGFVAAFARETADFLKVRLKPDTTTRAGD
jgi:tripartite-type tricarboxylate transporter receptor subunit TctC